MERPERPDLKVSNDFKEMLDPKDLSDSKDCKEMLGLKGLWDSKDPLDQQEPMVDLYNHEAKVFSQDISASVE